MGETQAVTVRSFWRRHMMSTRRSFFTFGALLVAVALLVPATALAQVEATAVTAAELIGTTTAAQVDYDSIKVTWTIGTAASGASAPVTGYRVYYADSDFTTAQNAMGNVLVDDDETLTVDVNGLDAGTMYYFRVAGVNAAGTGEVDTIDGDDVATGNNAVSAMTAAAPEPSIPTSVMAEGGDGTLMVSWTAPFSGGDGIKIDHYRVQKRELAGGLFGDWIPEEEDEDDMGKEINMYGKRVAGDMTSITFMDLDNGVTYQARVMAINDAGGMSAYSVRDGDNSAPGDESATTGEGDGMEDEEPMETPALPIVGLLLLGAGLVAAGRRRLHS